MHDFEEHVKKEYRDLFQAGVALIGIAAKLLPAQTDDSLQRMIRWLTASITNSDAALLLLCLNGHGADAVKIARGMFESLITLKYLVLNPSESRDFLDFDAVARYKRQQFYKSHYRKFYDTFPESKKSEVEQRFERVRKRFTEKNSKLRDRWSKHSIAEMARRTGLGAMYELFYRYASALHHVDPMGLGMLIDGDALEVLPAPTTAHVGIALAIGGYILLEALRDYGKLRGIDSEDALKHVEQLLGKSRLTSESDSSLSSLAHLIPRA